MFVNNIIMQAAATLALICVAALLVCTFIPSLEFEKDVEHPNGVRVVFLIVMLGLLRGAF